MVGSILASGFVTNRLNCLKVTDNDDNDRHKVMKLPVDPLGQVSYKPISVFLSESKTQKPVQDHLR